MAPGVAILAAIVPNNDAGTVPIGKKPSGYSIKSGTSMACPHVTGAAAILMSVHRGWTSSMIRSALMTTGTEILRQPFLTYILFTCLLIIEKSESADHQLLQAFASIVKP